MMICCLYSWVLGISESLTTDNENTRDEQNQENPTQTRAFMHLPSNYFPKA